MQKHMAMGQITVLFFQLVSEQGSDSLFFFFLTDTHKEQK